MTPCKFKTIKLNLGIGGKNWILEIKVQGFYDSLQIQNHKAEPVASSVENCRCEQLCKCLSQDYTSNLVNLTTDYTLTLQGVINSCIAYVTKVTTNFYLR